MWGVHVFPAYLHPHHTVVNRRQQKDWEKAQVNKVTKKVVEAAEDPKEQSGEKVETYKTDADAAEQNAEEGQVQKQKQRQKQRQKVPGPRITTAGVWGIEWV